VAQLHWRCRRGMKELDLLLEAYLCHRYPQAPVQEQRAFERLLEQPDPDLAGWLLYAAPPPRGELAIVLGQLAAMAQAGLARIPAAGGAFGPSATGARADGSVPAPRVLDSVQDRDGPYICSPPPES
jgi:antitoxin CptB